MLIASKTVLCYIKVFYNDKMVCNYMYIPSYIANALYHMPYTIALSAT